MGNIINISVKGKYFKSIGETEEGFEVIYPINIIIGRNNSGKSTLLDLIQKLIVPGEMPSHNGKHAQILLTKQLTQQEITAAFPDNTSGGKIIINHLEHGFKWLDKPLTVGLRLNADYQFVKIEPDLEPGGEYKRKLAQVFQNPLKGKSIRRIRADRDIVPEDHKPVELLENGQGATNIIQVFYNDSTKDRTLVTEKLLNSLNKIFSPDLIFKEIVVRRNPNNFYEIYLQEDNKSLIRLSDSGSGLKTVILVLINLLLVPQYTGEPLSKYIFAFEELENNLHPGLQRRLFNYIRDVAVKEHAYFFITTHSNIVIDLFNKDKDAQIIHVTHNGEFSTVKKIVTYIENKGILDDLDIRASDLLQSNGIVWVEGPSDRLYFNRWVELWSEGKIKEGTHYQCVFYGGRLLAHLSALDEQANEENGVNILRVNNYAILLIDSDKNNKDDNLNATKLRMISEIESVKGYSWVTTGHEVENYIPIESLKNVYNDTGIVQITPFDKFEEYLEKQISGEGKKYLKKKVLFAEKILPNLSRENLETVLDLSDKGITKNRVNLYAKDENNTKGGHIHTISLEANRE